MNFFASSCCAGGTFVEIEIPCPPRLAKRRAPFFGTAKNPTLSPIFFARSGKNAK